jgi:hypothetical protein
MLRWVLNRKLPLIFSSLYNNSSDLKLLKTAQYLTFSQWYRWRSNILGCYLLAYAFNYMHFERTYFHVEGQVNILNCYPLNFTQGANIFNDVVMSISPVFKDSDHLRPGWNLSVMISKSRNIVMFVNLNCEAFCQNVVRSFHLPQYKIIHSPLQWLISYRHPARN